MRGPKPRPESAHRQRGTKSRVGHNNPPGAAVSHLDAPETLSPAAALVWAEIAPALIEAGTITALDLNTVAAYCEVTAVSRAASDQLAKDGILTAEGKRHPAAGVYFNAIAEARRLGEQLGMSPASRPRVRPADPPPEPSPWDEFT